MARQPFFSITEDSDGEYSRTRTRQRIILKLSAGKETPEDEDDWKQHYPPDIIGWLVDTLEAIEWKYTPADILDTDTRYPGLWDAMGIELWQRKVISDQIGEPKDES